MDLTILKSKREISREEAQKSQKFISENKSFCFICVYPCPSVVSIFLCDFCAFFAAILFAAQNPE
jgi:hypothetical protein